MPSECSICYTKMHCLTSRPSLCKPNNSISCFVNWNVHVLFGFLFFIINLCMCVIAWETNKTFLSSNINPCTLYAKFCKHCNNAMITQGTILTLLHFLYKRFVFKMVSTYNLVKYINKIIIIKKMWLHF